MSDTNDTDDSSIENEAVVSRYDDLDDLWAVVDGTTGKTHATGINSEALAERIAADLNDATDDDISDAYDTMFENNDDSDDDSRTDIDQDDIDRGVANDGREWMLVDTYTLEIVDDGLTRSEAYHHDDYHVGVTAPLAQADAARFVEAAEERDVADDDEHETNADRLADDDDVLFAITRETESPTARELLRGFFAGLLLYAIITKAYEVLTDE